MEIVISTIGEKSFRCVLKSPWLAKVRVCNRITAFFLDKARE